MYNLNTSQPQMSSDLLCFYESARKLRGHNGSKSSPILSDVNNTQVVHEIKCLITSLKCDVYIIKN